MLEKQVAETGFDAGRRNDSFDFVTYIVGPAPIGQNTELVLAYQRFTTASDGYLPVILRPG